MNLILSLFLMSLRTPRDAAAHMIAQGWPRSAIWLALVLMVALNVMVLVIFFTVVPLSVPNPEPGGPALSLPTPSPLLMFIFSSGWAVLSVHMLTWAGRAFGGRGTLDQVASVWVLLQALRAAGVLIMLAGLLLFSPLAGLIGLAVAFLTIWVSTNFIAEAHGFETAWQAFGVLVAVFVGLTVGLMVLLTITSGFGSAIGAGNV